MFLETIVIPALYFALLTSARPTWNSAFVTVLGSTTYADPHSHAHITAPKDIPAGRTLVSLGDMYEIARLATIAA